MDAGVEWKDRIVFFLNGDKVEVDSFDPSLSVADYLRHNLGLTATKVGCGQGLCGKFPLQHASSFNHTMDLMKSFYTGACTVMLSNYDGSSKKISHRSVNACLLPLWYVDHKAITTLEGLGAVVCCIPPCSFLSSMDPCINNLCIAKRGRKGPKHAIQERFSMAHGILGLLLMGI